MIIISLLLGVILGAVMVIFILQNVAVVTVVFLGSQFSASLALVLLLTLLAGIVTALLMLLPSLIRDSMYLGHLKRDKRQLEDELDAYRKTVEAIPEAVTVVTTEQVL